MKEVKKEISRINKELDSDSRKNQIDEAFNEEEREVIKKTKNILGFSKARTIAIACQYLVEKLEEADKNEEKKDGEKI